MQIDAVTGAYPLDIDADGVMDIVVLRAGENLLLQGQGDCAFRVANAEFGLDGGDGWTTAFSATWEHDNRFPTLAFGNYVDQRRPRRSVQCPRAITVQWPDGYTARFEDVQPNTFVTLAR